jgi:serine protease
MALLVAIASAAGPLRLDPAAPPVRLGGNRYDFGRGVVLDVSEGVILELRVGVPPPVGARALGGPFWLLPTVDPVRDAMAFVGAPGVLSTFPDVWLPLERRTFDDPAYGGQWYLDQLGMDTLYAVSLGSADTRVAVIDSGIDISHPDLAPAVLAPYDAFSDDDDPSPDPGEFCTDGSSAICDDHGTAVSGIVAARADNGDGIVGFCPACTLVPIKLLGEGRGQASAEIAAFEHAIAQDVAVINNSWGYTEAMPVPEPLADVIGRAATVPRGGLGALVVFAAGNDDRELGTDELEALDDVLCVSGTDSYGYPVNYTNYGDAVDVAAPSATVTIAPGDTVITTFGGTSGAAPVVSGLAAWAAALDPGLDAAALHALLVDTATASPYIPATDHDAYYGYGNVSATGVLAALLPPEGEAPAETGCGCHSGGTSWHPLGLLLSLLLVRRRP